MENLEFATAEEAKQYLKWYLSKGKKTKISKEDEIKIDDLLMQHIKTYEDACNLLNKPKLETKKKWKLGLSNREIAINKLSTVMYALNGGKHIGVCHMKVEHWSPRFRITNINCPMVFSRSVNETDELSMGNGTLVTFKSKKLSDYCGKQFIKLWREVIL